MFRGFESHPLRQKEKGPTRDLFFFSTGLPGREPCGSSRGAPRAPTDVGAQRRRPAGVSRLWRRINPTPSAKKEQGPNRDLFLFPKGMPGIEPFGSSRAHELLWSGNARRLALSHQGSGDLMRSRAIAWLGRHSAFLLVCAVECFTRVTLRAGSGVIDWKLNLSGRWRCEWLVGTFFVSGQTSSVQYACCCCRSF